MSSPGHSGPAWTRNTTKHPSRPSPASPYSTPSVTAASSASSLSLASTSTQDAPYLTHVHLHHGRPTLVAPDNLGARRQPGQVDPPSARIDAHGGTGVQGVQVEVEASSEGRAAPRRKVKKKSDREKERERRDRDRKEQQILTAVANAGRTPSPLPPGERQLEAPSPAPARPAGMSRSESAGSSAGRLEVPVQGERRKKSRERPRPAQSEGTATPTAAAGSAPARSPRPSRPSASSAPPPPASPSPAAPPPAAARPLATASATRPSQPPPPASPAPPTQPTQPSSRTRNRANPRTRAARAQPAQQAAVLPPLAFPSPSPSFTDAAASADTAADVDAALDAHLSLGLVDPSMLLLSPPPAYPAGRRSESPPALDLGAPAAETPVPTAAMGTQAPPLPGGDAPGRRMSYLRPPPTPPPEPPSLLPVPSPSPPSSSDESEDDDAEDEDDLASSDPLVLAWEADRAAGLYSLDERIERDLARRRAAAVGAHSPSAAGGAGAQAQEGEAAEGAPPAPVPGGIPRATSPLPLDAASSSTAAPDLPTARQPSSAAADHEADAAALAQLRTRILRAEQANNSRGVVRALSVHATRSMSLSVPPTLPNAAPPPAAIAETGEAQGRGALDAARRARERARARALERLEGRSAAPAAIAEAPSEPSPAEQQTAEDDAPLARPARALSLSGHRLLAEAAERRMAAERAARARREAEGRVPPVVPEEGEGEEEGEQENEARDGEEEKGKEEQEQTSETYRRLFPPSPGGGVFGARPAGESGPAPPAPSTSSSTAAAQAPPPPPPASSKPRPPPPPPRSRPTSSSASPAPASSSSSSPAPAPSSAPTRQPSLRRPPPPPPPNARQILAARRASLRPVAVAPRTRAASLDPTLAEPESSPRRRPLPTPPAALEGGRVDAFTALRAARALGTAAGGEQPPAGVPSPPAQAQVQVDHPGPPLPRRPPSLRVPSTPAAATAPTPASDDPLEPAFSAYTDLDLLLARLEAREEERERGRTGDGEGAESERQARGEGGEGGESYDDLLLLSDVLGTALPAGASPAELSDLTVARVECERRRVTKSGKVKSKMSVVGVRCTDCAICLARFKVDQFAVVLPECLHIFHDHCIRSWFRLSRVCPVCRKEAFAPRPPPSEDLLQ
ncbi:hypothetical protein JCM10207_004849 [Rhodosporidiobolus poonsookiae]